MKPPKRSACKLPRKPRSNPKTKHQAIKLRKDLIPAERKLWSKIRNDQLGVPFRRQHAVGKYIPDFCSPKAKLIIEMDGPPFGRSPRTGCSPARFAKQIVQVQVLQYDVERTKYLESQGYKVIRFWNNQVMNDVEGVIRAIRFAMESEVMKEN